MTNKVTSIIKKYFFLMALVAMVGGFSAFKVNEYQIADDHWFEVNNVGEITSYLPDGPAANCNLDDSQLYMCAVRLSDQQVDDPNAETPSPTITNPDLGLEQKYRATP